MSRRATWGAGGGALLLCCAALVAAVLLSSSPARDKPDPPRAREASTVGPTIPADPPHPGDPKVSVSVSDRTVGAPIASGFLGFSFEFQGVRAYTGSDPAHVNPVLVQLIRNLTPGQAPVLRIGGNSTDLSYVVGPGVKPLRYQGYELTPSWMATTGALAKALGAHMIMGVNLAANEPQARRRRGPRLRDRPARGLDRGGGDRQRAQHLQQDHRLPHGLGQAGPRPSPELRLPRSSAGSSTDRRPDAASQAGGTGARGRPDAGSGLVGRRRRRPAAARAADLD